MKNNYLFASILFTITLISSCKKDEPSTVTVVNPIIKQGGGVHIVDEGGFMLGNAKISYYDFVTAACTEDLFQPANNRPLGDIAQSICFANNKAYVVVNNSGKIEVVNPKTFVSTATISGFTSPRYILPVSNNKAYVSDLFSNIISVVDLTNNTITGGITSIGWTEQMALAYGKVFVTNENSSKVFVINTLNDVIEDSITIAYGGNSIVEDKFGKLWVLSGGNTATSVFPSLSKINPLNDSVEASFQFPNLSDAPWNMTINGSLDKLYYLAADGVHSFSIASAAIDATPLIAKASFNFYGLGVDPSNDIIYVSDAIDFVQKGTVMRYRTDGTLINSFKAGVNPSRFYFQ